jgi:2-oxo-3-hexenedioate decarboxylase
MVVGTKIVRNLQRMSKISKMAAQLHHAQRQQQPIAQFSTQQALTLVEAYEVQHELMKLRCQEGETLIGVKMGFTSEAKMQQMGVSEMIIGQLSDAMFVSNGGSVHRSHFIHPRVEPEIAFRLKKDITQPIELHEVLDYVDGIAAALEIIDSRYENFKFSLEDVVADNCSSAAYVLGILQEPLAVLTDLDMTLVINDNTVESGSSNDILGNPWKSLVAASALATKYKLTLKSGDIVLAGAATSAHFIKEHNEISAEVAQLETVFFRMLP